MTAWARPTCERRTRPLARHYVRPVVDGWRVIGGGDPASPWIKANDAERLQALALVERYADADDWTAERLADFYACAEHLIRNARWLAVVSGLLERTGDRFTVTDNGRKELTNG